MKRMSTRILRAIMIAVIAVVVCSLAVIIAFTYNYFYDNNFSNLKIAADFAAAGVEGEGIAYLESVDDPNIRVTLIESDGTVVYDNSADIGNMENHADREEFREAVELGEGYSSRYSSTLSRQTLYYAVRLEDHSVVRISTTRVSVFSLAVSMLQPIVVILLITLILSAFLAARLAKSVVRPINDIDLEHPEDTDTYEEISPLLAKLASQNAQIKKQMKELARRQLEFTTITENMSEGLLVIGNKTELLSYNASAMRLLGTDFSHKYKDSVFALNRSDTFRHVVTAALSGSHSEDMLYAGGRCYQIIANPVSDTNKIRGAVILILDVTEREERDTLRREFTANVSHELKTPLTSISGFAEIIRNGLVKPDDIPSFAANIYDEAQRLIALIGDIIKLSRLDENSVALDSEDIDLYDLCADITERLSPAVKKKGIMVSLSGQHRNVHAPRAIVDEMVYNLVDNAVKYNKENGNIDLFVTSDAQNKPVLRVSDTGIGIPATDRERVFERFYRVNKSHSKEIGGTGLGLSIVKHAATFLGASLDLQSELDVGTTVTVTFSVREDK